MAEHNYANAVVNEASETGYVISVHHIRKRLEVISLVVRSANLSRICASVGSQHAPVILTNHRPPHLSCVQQQRIVYHDTVVCYICYR